MKASEIREMNPDELEGRLNELERQLFDLRTQSVTENVENTQLAHNIRHDIARIKTVIRERQSKDQ
ncbi:MAG: 50S ribosomal protein L29 [Planctomycetota bacterium]